MDNISKSVLELFDLAGPYCIFILILHGALLVATLLTLKKLKVQLLLLVLIGTNFVAIFFDPIIRLHSVECQILQRSRRKILADVDDQKFV